MHRHPAPERYGMVKHGLCPWAVTVCQGHCTQGKVQQRSPRRAREACRPPCSLSWAALASPQNSHCPGRCCCCADDLCSAVPWEGGVLWTPHSICSVYLCHTLFCPSFCGLCCFLVLYCHYSKHE